MSRHAWIDVALWSILILVIIVLALLLSIRRYLQYESAKAAMERAQAAHREAVSAHDRIDRLDDDIKTEHTESLITRLKLATIQGWVKFVMHRDISDELKKQHLEEQIAADEAKSKEAGNQL